MHRPTPCGGPAGARAPPRTFPVVGSKSGLDFLPESHYRAPWFWHDSGGTMEASGWHVTNHHGTSAMTRARDAGDDR
jgi:hypothetical protein